MTATGQRSKPARLSHPVASIGKTLHLGSRTLHQASKLRMAGMPVLKAEAMDATASSPMATEWSRRQLLHVRTAATQNGAQLTIRKAKSAATHKGMLCI